MSRFSRKKFAVFFRILSQSNVEFLVYPHHPIMLKFASLSYETVASVISMAALAFLGINLFVHLETHISESINKSVAF